MYPITNTKDRTVTNIVDASAKEVYLTAKTLCFLGEGVDIDAKVTALVRNVSARCPECASQARNHLFSYFHAIRRAYEDGVRCGLQQKVDGGEDPVTVNARQLAGDFRNFPGVRAIKLHLNVDGWLVGWDLPQTIGDVWDVIPACKPCEAAKAEVPAVAAFKSDEPAHSDDNSALGTRWRPEELARLRIILNGRDMNMPLSQLAKDNANQFPGRNVNAIHQRMATTEREAGRGRCNQSYTPWTDDEAKQLLALVDNRPTGKLLADCFAEFSKLSGRTSKSGNNHYARLSTDKELIARYEEFRRDGCVIHPTNSIADNPVSATPAPMSAPKADLPDIPDADALDLGVAIPSADELRQKLGVEVARDILTRFAKDAHRLLDGTILEYVVEHKIAYDLVRARIEKAKYKVSERDEKGMFLVTL